MKLAYDYLVKLFSFESNLEKDLMRLARIEYGRDWEWAYNQLVEGKTPLKGVTL